MASLKHWVDVNASPKIAEREWQRFAFMSMIGGFRMPNQFVQWSEVDTAQRDALVSFYGYPSGVTRVTFAIDYDACTTTHASDEVDRLIRSRLYTYRSSMEERFGAAAAAADEAFVSAFRHELPSAA